jgi:hypothetical protein
MIVYRGLRALLAKMVRNARCCNFAQLLSRHCPLPSHLECSASKKGPRAHSKSKAKKKVLCLVLLDHFRDSFSASVYSNHPVCMSHEMWSDICVHYFKFSMWSPSKSNPIFAECPQSSNKCGLRNMSRPCV